MTILLAVLAGGALGVVLARGEFCFHATWRRLFQNPMETSLLRAYTVLILVSTPLVQLFRLTGLIDPFIPPLAPAAALSGGLLFGAGMVIAKTCISGIFYKLGAGMLGMIVALVAWAAGDIITWRGPLSDLRERLNSDPIMATASDGSQEAATVGSWLGPIGIVLVILAGLGLATWVARDEAVAVPSHDALTGRAPKLRGARLGFATAGVMTVAWLLVRWHGGDYIYGTSGVPSQLWNRVVNGGDISWWIPLALISVIPAHCLQP